MTGRSTMLALLLAALACTGAGAQVSGGAGHGAHTPPLTQGEPVIRPGTVSDWADGEIRRIDRENGRLTIRHGDIPSLDMPPMSMVFGVRERSWIDALKPGDRIRFKATVDQGSNKFTVVELEPVR